MLDRMKFQTVRPWRMLRILLEVLAVFFCSSIADRSWIAQAEVFLPVLAEPGHEKYRLQQELYYFDNSKDQVSKESILSGALDQRFTQHHKYGLHVGFPKRLTPGDYWLGMRLQNRTGHDLALYINGSAKPSLSRIYFFKEGADTPEYVVDIEKHFNRSNLNINVRPGDWKVYVEVTRDIFGYHFIFASLRSYENIIHHSPEKIFIAVSLGVCIALLIYNLVLAFTMHSRSHYLYVLYNLSVVLYFEGNSQILSRQFGFYEIPIEAMLTISCISVLLFVIFVADILNIKKQLPAWKWVFYSIYFLCSIILVGQFLDHPFAMKLLNILILSTVPLSLGVGIHAIIKRVPTARLMLLTMMLPAVGSFVGLQASLFDRWLPIAFVACAQPLGIDLEMILLSMIVGYKIRKEHQSLRNKRDHAYNELKKIVYPHQVTDVWEGRSLESTMPVGRSHAYALVFDVIASSKISLDNPRTFLSGVFQRCSNLMMENYDGQRMIANAYRVKEMGDGFLCTIGFPFACPKPEVADHSLQLAQQFLEIFEGQVKGLSVTSPIHCCIGIAYGPIEAFYPDSGAKVYDLFGRGIVLAYRYESMRDLLFPLLKQKGSIIILQKQVFDALSRDNQKKFGEMDLKAAKISVRDDEDAHKLYYYLSQGVAMKKEEDMHSRASAS